MRVTKVMASAAAAGAILAMSSAAAFAGSTLESYSTTVGAWNGNGYTSNQTKSTSAKTGELQSAVVGGSYTLTGWMQTSGGQNQQQVDYITDNVTYSLPNNVAKGVSVRVHFRNGLVTPVSVQASGKWKSN